MGRLCGCYGRYGGEVNVPSKGWNSVNVETAAEASLLQREAAPLSLFCCSCDLKWDIVREGVISQKIGASNFLTKVGPRANLDV